MNTAAISGGRLTLLQQYKAAIVAFIGAGPKWIHEISQHMKEIGAQPRMKDGLNFKKAWTLLDFLVDDRGQVAVPNALLMSPFLLLSPGELASNGPARDDVLQRS